MQNRIHTLARLVAIPLLLASLLVSCDGDDTSTTVAGELDSLSATLAQNKPRNESTRYKLPSPVELYLHLRSSQAVPAVDKLHSPVAASNYMTDIAKSVNFGIYASDLAYCTVFENFQQTNEYFRVTKILAGQLGITEGYNNLMMKRLASNLNNSDSLFQISSDTYWEVCSSLENSGKSNTLALILLGGWVESVYLAVHSVETFDGNSEIILRITEQSYLLENLLDYLNTLSNDKKTLDYVEKLIDLQYSFDKLFDNPDDVLITKKQYQEISEKIKYIRADLISWQ